jgi:rare lipoprotein A
VRYTAGSDDRKVSETPRVYRVGQVFSGIVSYYAAEFHGRKTANGEIFNMYDRTAAHQSLPFNTLLQVTNPKNGKKVLVRVNDRGPFKANRILDLSYQAAKDIGLIQEGTASLTITIIRLGKE